MIRLQKDACQKFFLPCLLFLAQGLWHERAQAAPEVVVDVDIFDEIVWRDHPLTDGDVQKLVSDLKQNGCNTIIVRCAVHDLFLYPSKLSAPLVLDAEHARSKPLPPGEKDIDSYIAERSAWNKMCADAVRDVNPPAAFIKHGHDQGMKVLVWIDLFDTGWPGYRSKFLDENPQCQWVGKDGKTYFYGLTDYSWPEARAYRIAQAKELLDMGADGIHCSTCSHSRHLPNVQEVDFYGYSDPVVQAYKEKHGVDIRTAKEFDRSSWHDLKGDAMLQLYREIAALCHERGKELWMGLQLGQHTQFNADPLFSGNAVARYSNHWKTLVDERLADAFILADYEVASGPDLEYWAPKTDIQRAEGEDLYAWAARTYQPYCKGKTRLFVFSEWMQHPLKDTLKFWADVTLKNGFDGLDVHESWDLQADPEGMQVLREVSERFAAGK